MADRRAMCGIGVRRRPAGRGGRWLASALGAIAAFGSTVPAAAGQLRELAREATPLVLKDGRIAHVAIWAVPFRPGASDLDPEVKVELAGLVETFATDCFLTAQAIGHVEPEAVKAGESLAAHRLARARADRIQQVMVERGLQASAIASVWDWQFLVKEPRVTVWVFRLHEGEDCEGKRLERPTASMPAGPPGARELPVRTATAASPAERSTAERATAPAPAGDTTKAPAAARVDRPTGTPSEPTDPAARAAAPAPMPGSTPPPRPLIASRPTPPPAPSLPGASAAADEVLVSPLSAEAQTAEKSPSPSAAGEQPRPVVAATAPGVPSATVAEARPADRATPGAPSRPDIAGRGAGRDGTEAAAERRAGDRSPRTTSAVSAAGAGRSAAPGTEVGAPAASAAVDPARARGSTSVEIVFDVNSSYLPKGAAAELRRFLEGLPAGGVVRLEIVGAVGGADVKDAQGTAAVRYNRWLAERRIARVADWLKENAGGRRIEIGTAYAEDDPSRRVTVRLAAGG